MFALLWMLDARAERIVLDAGSDALRLGENLSVQTDWDGDGVDDILATGSDTFTTWKVYPATATFSGPTTVRAEAARGSAISTARGLADTTGVSADGVILHGVVGSVGAYAGYTSASWPSDQVATTLSRYPEAWLADTFISGASRAHVMGIPDTGRGGVGELRIYDGGLANVGQCLGAVAGFGSWALMTSKATGDGLNWLFVATEQASTTTVAWWTLDMLTPTDTCVAVPYDNAGPSTSFEVPAVGMRYAFAQGTVDRGAWIAIGDEDGALHVHAFLPGTLEGGATTRPFNAAYKMGVSGFATAVRVVAADVVGDATPDLLVANPDEGRRGTVWAWEGRKQRDGSVVFAAEPWKAWTGLVDGDAFGTSIGALADVDGDGKQELVAGAVEANGERGQVHVLLSHVDTDGDGLYDPDDCAPDDGAGYPGAEWYRDADGDGQGDPVASFPFNCDGMPADTVPNATDCDDGDPDVYDGATVWVDADTDGQGDGASGSRGTSFTLTCPWTGAPYATNARDCDDTRADVYQGAPEACDRADNDCNGLEDDGVGGLVYTDGDGDGFGAGEGFQACPTEGTVDNDGDCDDTRADVHPNAEDLPSDGLDQDCDDAEVVVTWGRGACGCAASSATDASLWLAAASFAGMALRGRRARR